MLFAKIRGKLKMNVIKNDFGDWVEAVGCPGSIERMKVEYPKLISELNEQISFSKALLSVEFF